MASYASTFKGVQDAVIAKLRLAEADRAKTKDWINQALLRAAVDTQFFTGATAGSALTAASSSQALPTAIVALDYLTSTYGGQSILMRPVGFDQILLYRSSSGSGSGPPFFYTLRKNTVEFWPSAQGGEILTYYGAVLPDALSGDSDVSGLPEPYATKVLEFGACIDAADFKGDLKLYYYYQTAFQSQLALLQTFLSRRRTETSQQVPVYGPDGRPFTSPFLPHDPGSDYYVTGFRGL